MAKAHQKELVQGIDEVPIFLTVSSASPEPSGVSYVDTLQTVSSGTIKANRYLETQ